jgi:hypothetical protein
MPGILPERDEPTEPLSREEFIMQQPAHIRFAYRAGELWRKRPDFITMHYYYLPMIVAAGAFAVGAVDQEFHLHLAKDMAADRATPHEGFISHTFDGLVHDIGTEAEKMEK